MSTPIDLEQVHIVAYGLNEVIDEAFHLLQGIMAFGEKYPDKVILPLESDWYALAYSALLKSLVIETASLLDRAKYRKDSNCNFRELQEVLESNACSRLRAWAFRVTVVLTHSRSSSRLRA